MRKVTVSIPEVHTSYITLEVDDDADDQDIKERANVLLESGDYKNASGEYTPIEYSHTMDMDMWDITDDTTVTCKCANNCEASSKDTNCPCFNIPCEDDEGLCEHLRGCLHGECECECEF